MSDHPKEAERNLKGIYICDDVCFDLFYWLSPPKVGLELALVSHRFDALVDTHFKRRKWTLGKLEIHSSGNIFKMNFDGSEKTLPFPQKSLPTSIVGFARFDIRLTNPTAAIAFLQRIGRLLESDISLKFCISMVYNWNVFATSIWPLLNVSAIIKIHFEYPSVFQHFRHLISPTVLRDCVNLQKISFDCAQFVQFPPDDSDGSSDDQALCKWLHTPLADGQPKVLKLKIWWDVTEVPTNALKTTFLDATTSASFIILYGSVTCAVPFKLVNSLTREQLISRTIDNADGDDSWLIERSPIDKCAEQWDKWEKEALEDGTNDWKVLRMRP